MYDSTRVSVFAMILFAVATTLAAGAALAAAEQVDELVHNALQLDVDPERGRDLYRLHCISCHGTRGHGSAARKIPALAGQRQAYIIKQLADFSELERDSADMHVVVAKPEIAAPQAWADIAAFLNNAPVARSPQRGSGSRLELGEAIFREQCATCHEEDARGDDDGFAPSLRNQHYAYLLQETRRIAASHRHNVDEDFVRFLGSFEDDEIEGVADYLSRLRAPTKDRARMRDDGSVGD